MVVLLAAGVVGGFYYVGSVEVPKLLDLPASTTLYYNDGSVLARLGNTDRTPVGLQELLPFVAQAAVDGQDPDFWTSGTRRDHPQCRPDRD